jgi:hypothetical protein
MKISRYGSSADHGVSTIALKDPTCGWSENLNVVTLKKSRVADFNTESRHNYTVTLSLQEIGNILEVVAEEALKNPDLFEKSLQQALKPLLKLQYVLAGMVLSNSEV